MHTCSSPTSVMPGHEVSAVEDTGESVSPQFFGNPVVSEVYWRLIVHRRILEGGLAASCASSIVALPAAEARPVVVDQLMPAEGWEPGTNLGQHRHSRSGVGTAREHEHGHARPPSVPSSSVL